MYLSSWSGGKDGALACHRALKRGVKVAGLVNFISDDYKRVRFHGVQASLIRHQADLAGIKLYQKETTAEGYEREFKEAVKEIPDVTGMLFGDIYIDEHRQWVERVCRDMGINADLPLWLGNAPGLREKTEGILREFIAGGFEAVVVSGQKEFIDKEWIGKRIDGEFLAYLKDKPEADICGERGEYHTFVTGGPLLNGKIEITGSSVIEKNGYYFLDIKDFEVRRFEN